MFNKNLMLALFLSIIILWGFEIIVGSPNNNINTINTNQQNNDKAATKDSYSKTNNQTNATQSTKINKKQLRVKIANQYIKGSINRVGAIIDDITLNNYYETKQRQKHVTILKKENSANPYYVQFNWLQSQNQSTIIELPKSTTEWQVVTNSPKQIILKWINKQNIIFKKTFNLDNKYLITVTDEIINNTQKDLNLNYQSNIIRKQKEYIYNYTSHEGFIGINDGILQEHDYDDIQEQGVITNLKSNAWTGISDQYWLTAITINNNHKLVNQIQYLNDNNYSNSIIVKNNIIKTNGSDKITTNLFVGAKELKTLQDYQEQYKIDNFDNAIDFGWFYFITKPFLYFLTFLNNLLGNFGLAILAFTVIIKIILLPMANKSYISMARLKELQPKIQILRERFSNDQQKLNKEIFSLYKKENVNPLSGCLPVIAQIPIFFALYKVLFVSIEMYQANFMLWMDDLSAPDDLLFITLFGLVDWNPPAFLQIGVLPILMGMTMWLQQKMSATTMDPNQQKIMLILPLILTFVLAGLPSGLVLYWTWSNVLSIVQQWFITKRMQRNKTA